MTVQHRPRAKYHIPVLEVLYTSQKRLYRVNEKTWKTTDTAHGPWSASSETISASPELSSLVNPDVHHRYFSGQILPVHDSLWDKSTNNTSVGKHIRLLNSISFVTIANYHYQGYSPVKTYYENRYPKASLNFSSPTQHSHTCPDLLEW